MSVAETTESIVFPEAVPVIRTERLMLRPVVEADAPNMVRWFNDIDVARQTATMPFPYTAESAQAFLERLRRRWEEKSAFGWAIELLDPSSALAWHDEPLTGYLGSLGFHDISAEHRRAELGYVICRPAWGRGLATEAARAVLRFGFETMRFRRVHASWYAGNDASGRVLAKLGFREEGRQVEHALRFGTFRDVILVGLLRTEWEAQR